MSKITSSLYKLKDKTSLKLLLKSLIWAFALLGVLFILLFIALLGLVNSNIGKTVTLPERAILQIDFDTPLAEVASDSLLNDLTGESTVSFYDLVKAISMAAEDDGIKAIFARVGQSDLSLSQIEELRDLIFHFRQTGKKAYIFSESFGAFGGGMSEYYLASAFDEIILQPGGDLGITGISIEMPFMRKLLNRIGIKPEFYARYEYKNAFSSFTDEKMSQSLRQELDKLGSSLFSKMVADISASRGIKEQKLLELIDQAPLSAQDSLAQGLVDELAYSDNLLRRLKTDYDAEPFDWRDYLLFFMPQDGKQTLGILTVTGEISSGPSVFDPLQGAVVAGAESFVSALNELSEIKDLKALVVRIDSPGGSYLAADYMRQALADFKSEKQIPVVVSMSSYAASGGYFIALPADVIFAQDLSITGSIGVLGGKPVLSGLWQKLDINWQGVSFGRNADIMSINQTFSASEQTIFNRSLDNVYQDFVAKTSSARHISLQDMDKVARGRIWSGEQAKANGLIDAIGGYNEAISKAIELSSIDPDKPLKVEFYPHPKSMQEKISELLSSGSYAIIGKLKTQIGLDKDLLNVLQRLKYDAVMPPVLIQY